MPTKDKEKRKAQQLRYSLKNREKILARQRVRSKRRYAENREEFKRRASAYYGINKEKVLARAAEGRDKAKAYYQTLKSDFQKGFFRLLLSNIRQRCTNPKRHNYASYGGRGISCLLTVADLKSLWERDNASSLKKPSIDRIDVNGNYVYENCRFIELSENVRIANIGVSRK